jgi:hypothetical protein
MRRGWPTDRVAKSEQQGADDEHCGAGGESDHPRLIAVIQRLGMMTWARPQRSAAVEAAGARGAVLPPDGVKWAYPVSCARKPNTVGPADYVVALRIGALRLVTTTRSVCRFDRFITVRVATR